MKGTENKIYGYARVSTVLQREDRQIASLRNYGVEESNIYLDKISGLDFNRPIYLKLLRKIKSGDTLVIKSLDRLGRNYEEIKEQWSLITKKKKAVIIVTDMPILDTNVESRGLTDIFISDLVLYILSYVSEFEVTFLKQRQAEGIAIAQEKGIRFGRPPIQLPPNFEQTATDYKQNKITLCEALKQTDLSRATFYRRLYDIA